MTQFRLHYPISRRIIFALFAVLFSVNLWGQGTRDLIDLEDCTITINGDAPYLCTSTNVTILSSHVDVWYKDDYDVIHHVNHSGFTISIGGVTLDSEHPMTKEIGKYTLTVTGNGTICKNSKTKVFYVLPGESSYYTISSLADWGRFAECVLDGYSFAGLTVILKNDVGTDDEPVNTMVGGLVGSDYRYFSGTFDGNYNDTNHTLNFYRNADGYGYAPFNNTLGATIKNLNVTGSVLSTYGYAAGLIAFNEGDTYIQNVTVSVTIDDGGWYYCGGFVAESHGNSSIIHFSNCVYNGKITAAGYSAGFVSPYDDDGTSTFENCIFNPTADSEIYGDENFGLVDPDDEDAIINCYYTMQVGSSEQGTRLYKNHEDAPDDIIVKPWEVLGENVYGPVTVTTTAEETYLFNSEINYYSTVTGCDVTFDGVDVEKDKHYTVIVKKDNNTVIDVTAAGEYSLIITATGTDNYHGSYTKTFYVVSELTGEGTSANPFKIRSSADWLVFANHVNNGDTYTDAAKTEHPYSEAYYRLTNDITTSVMVGTSSHPFSGNFNGRIGNTYGAYTLTFNYGTAEEPTKDVIVAPFRYTNGATIQSLILHGAIYTNAGKEAGLIGINTSTDSNYTTVSYVINYMDFHCYEELWDAQGGGYAYDGSDVHFSYSSYEGLISASNYHGGFCGKANGGTRFERCLFDPEAGGMYWAENFVYDAQGANINYDGPTSAEDGCYYTVGNNQEESEQGTMVYVNNVPNGSIGHLITNFHEKQIYKPVAVIITGVNKRYLHTGNDITITPGVSFNGTDALANDYCEWSITPSPVNAIGVYEFTVTAPKTGVASDYLGTVSQLVRVVESSNTGWTGLQTKLSGSDATIDLTEDITAGVNDVCLVVESGRNVTINLNGYTINRGYYQGNDTWSAAVVGGQVLKVASGATVVIYGNNAANPTGASGKIKGGCNKASSNAEHADNSDGGGIVNNGNLTLNNVTVEGNHCEKYTAGISRTARGGGIYSGINSSLIIKNCTITHNEAKGGGGGIYAEKAAVFMMDGTTVQSNKSQDKGGGIRVDATGTQHYVGESLVANALINNCTINNNTVELHTKESASNGGGIHHDDGTLDLTNCTIQQNNSSKYGGGIYIMKGTINATSCNISYNRSYDSSDKFEGYGGGVCILGGTVKMNGGTVSGNSSYKEDGGGVFVASGKTFKIEGNVIVSENWTYDNASLENKHETNVYLVGTNDKITITGSIAGASIGVSKNGNIGVFTSGLNGKGTINNFSSDNSAYSIVSYDNEAKLAEITPVTPPSSGEWSIDEPVILNTTVSSDVTSIVIGSNGCLYVNEGGYINGIPITNNTTNAVNKLVINGGQVIPSNSGVPATVKKDINYALPLSQGNWYLISSPLVTLTGENPVVYNPISILNNTNLIVKNANNYPEYDLYRFNEAVDLQWENYRATTHDDFTTLEKGRGYLYRNYNDYTITMTGVINVESSINYVLSYHEQVNEHDNKLTGFNIIGNPYTHNIYKGAAGSAIPNGTLLESKYYVLNLENADPNNEPSGMWQLTDDGTAIPPMTGILVQAKAAGTLVMANSTDGDVAPSSKSAENNNIWFSVANGKYEDRACVEFREGHGLNKIAHLNEEAPMLYVNYNDEDFASVDMNPETKAFDLNFEAKTMGRYTLNVKPQGEFSYLHLFDKVEGSDIDLLAEGEYSFIGSPSDSKDRFVVRLSETVTNDNGNVIFAYQSGDDIVVSGEGELRVFDMMGRLVAQKHVNGIETMCTSSLQTGVYIFRLNEVSQKIVVK